MELASLARLERSHRRHDEMVTNLVEAARRIAAGRPDDGDLERVREAVAFLESAVTRHFLDEDGSVFPRLSTRRPELAPELASLSAEHKDQTTLQRAVATAAHAVTNGGLRPSSGKELLDAAMALADAHSSHVGREDTVLAFAQGALTADDDAVIVAEMETRRDRDGVQETTEGETEPARAAKPTKAKAKPTKAKAKPAKAKANPKPKAKPAKAKSKAKPAKAKTKTKTKTKTKPARR
jgi:hemerythrin-like domain-containing protein